jgi:2-polyprenyl-6-methoxyphenol hydroxylase-like FAD-dependent oxidoreductase
MLKVLAKKDHPEVRGIWSYEGVSHWRGIGGLATALSLHAVGIECEVFERSRGIRELGVGLNMLPHAVKELAEIGLLDALDRVAIRTDELIYTSMLRISHVRS